MIACALGVRYERGRAGWSGVRADVAGRMMVGSRAILGECWRG